MGLVSARFLLWFSFSFAMGLLPAAEVEAETGDPVVAGSAGSARWAIPIEVPPGSGGFAPEMAVAYSSSAGDGPFGLGWRLVPLGEIACSVRHGVPRYIRPGGAPCPQFELDGELLIPGSARYHTFIESFHRILDRGANGWEVTSPDGTIRRYGETSNSRILARSGNVARWLLSSIEDPSGNQISFVYDGDPSTDAIDLPVLIDGERNGHTYIRKISYGSNSARVVEIEYGDRPDPIHDYTGGLQRLIDQRATAIHVRSNGATYARYLLGYDLYEIGKAPAAADYSTARSRLSWVQRVGGDGQALPAQEFRYSDPGDVGGGVAQWNPDAFEAPPISFDNQGYWPAHPSAVRTGDVDGDGLVDIVVADQGTGERKVWINKKTRWQLDPSWSSALAGLQFGAPRVNVTVYDYPASITASPYLTKVCDADYVEQPSGVFFADPTFHNALNVQFPFRSEGGAFPPQLYVQLGGNFHLVDLDGDGRADLVMSMRLSGIYRTHDCTTGAELAPWQRIEPQGREVRVVFRNTGTTWVEDPDLARGLPLFGMVATESNWVGSRGVRYDSCTGLISETFDWSRNHGALEVYPCINYADFAPAFTDLNGDGRADVIAAVPNAPEPTMVVSNVQRPWQLSTQFDVSTTASRAWIQQPGTGWVRDAAFDLPFHHALLSFVGDTQDPDQSFIAHSWASTGDAGVRIVDRNRDGLADVTWVDPYQDTEQPWCQFSPCPPEPRPVGSPRAPRGVLLNRGGGGQLYSAWCSSRPIAGIASCSAASEAARFELPAGERFAEVAFQNFRNGAVFTESAGVELGDVNGDGWLDLVRASGSNFGEPAPLKTFLFSPGGSSAWVDDPRFTPPTPLGYAYSSSDGVKWNSDGRLLDLDGDDALDFSRGPTSASSYPDPRSWVGKRGLSDLLREVRTGRGGTIRIAYDTGPRRRDVALDTRAAAHATDPAIAEPLGLTGETHPSHAPVVAQVTVEGPNRVASTTHYRYADPRWDRAQRMGLGFRLVEQTGPDGTVVESFYYQKHGRAGRLSERIVSDQGRPIRSSEAVWQVLAPTQADDIPGAWPHAGSAEVSHLGRLVSRASRNEYGSSGTGAEQAETFEYDDAYGYNFVAQIHEVRPSTETVRVFVPASADTTNWIMGLVRQERVEDQRGSWASRTDFTYYGTGRIATQRRERWRGSGVAAVDETSYTYDAFGNLASRTDANGHTTAFGYDGTGSVLTSRTDPPAVPGEPGRVTTYTPHAVFGVPRAITPGYTDVPRTQLVFDAFGRVAETRRMWEGAWVLVSETIYSDHTSPPTVEQLDYTTATDFIRTAVVDDGFGGTWKTIRGGGTGGYVGSATYRDPAQRLTRTTEDLACGTQPFCAGLVGTEPRATATATDPLGRPLSVSTPRGTSRFAYTASSTEPIIERHSGASALFGHPVDVVWSQNAKGDLSRKAFDGDRVLAVDECTNSNPTRTDPASTGCANANGRNRTLYGYHASGQLEVIHDPIGAANLTSARHRLRYHYDTAGLAIAIDDPDAGHSETYYDGVGNVRFRLNQRMQSRETRYDPLDRPKMVLAPEGNVAFSYRPGEFQVASEHGPGYVKSRWYDDFGRVASESVGGDRAWYEHDLQGRETAMKTAPSAMSVRHEYAGAFLQRVCSFPSGAWHTPCSDPGATRIISSVAYDALGRRQIVEMASGTRTYDYRDEQNANAPRDLVRDWFAGRMHTLTLDYGARDALGNLLGGAITGSSGVSGVDAAFEYTYDARNRLASWERTADGLTLNESFTYDPLGNLTRNGGVAQEFAHETKPHALTRRGAKEYAYDASGNLSRSGVDRHYAFDSAERLIRAGTSANGNDLLSVSYDAAGQRIYEVAGATRRFFLNADQSFTRVGNTDEHRLEIRAFGEVVAYAVMQRARAGASAAPALPFDPPPWLLALVPLSALGSCLGLALRGGLLIGIAQRPGAAALSGVLIASLAIPVPAWAGSGWTNSAITLYWVLSDPLGSSVAVFDESGFLVRQTRFAPFGGIDREFDGGAATAFDRPRHFAGHLRQEETRLYYMNARWQDPETGMFLSVDPVIRDIATPQSLNAYAYAENNPITFDDPTGACLPPECRWYGEIPPGQYVPSHAQVADPGSLADYGVTAGTYAGDIADVISGNEISRGFFDFLFTTPTAPGTWAANDGVSPDGRWVGGTQPQMQSVLDSQRGWVGHVAHVLGWDLALAFAGNLGNLYGMTRGLVTTLAGVATLNPLLIASGLSQFGWALVPRYGWWSGPGWGQPNLEALGYWYGPYGAQNVIEYATYWHDQDFANPGADRQLIRDVWSRHDLGPYAQVYRVGLTAVFGTRVALGLDD